MISHVHEQQRYYATATVTRVINREHRTQKSAILHASVTWPLSEAGLQRLRRSDRAMNRLWICNVNIEDTAMVRSRSVAHLNKLGIESLDVILCEKRLRWNGHVERSSGATSRTRLSTCKFQEMQDAAAPSLIDLEGRPLHPPHATPLPSLPPLSLNVQYPYPSHSPLT